MRTSCLPVLLCHVLALLPAQDPPPAQPDRQAAILVDTVIATVNDAAIMLSTIRTQVATQIPGLEDRLGRTLHTQEIATLFARALDDEVQRHSLAQSAKSFGIASPEQVEQLFQEEMKREEQEQVRDFGTWQEFSRELQRQNRTWQTYLREQRVEKMYNFAREFAISMRMQKQSNLFLTPHMLRETYRREVHRFVHGAEADLAVVRFTGPAAEEHARQAATTWAQQELSPMQLVNAVPGATGTVLGVLRDVGERSRDALAKELVEFAMQGPEGRVSAPMAVEGGFHIAKIVGFRAARDGRFEDPEVQLELHEICLDSVRLEFLRQALERAADRTEVWKAKLFR